MAKSSTISLKGLDNFSKQFLLGNGQNARKGDAEYITVSEGQKLPPAALKHYDAELTRDFIKRAGSFTEDLVAFIVEQKRMRDLDDTSVIFALALANINLRNSYGNPRIAGAPVSAADTEKLLNEFDTICVGAQEYYDANPEDT